MLRRFCPVSAKNFTENVGIQSGRLCNYGQIVKCKRISRKRVQNKPVQYDIMNELDQWCGIVSEEDLVPVNIGIEQYNFRMVTLIKSLRYSNGYYEPTEFQKIRKKPEEKLDLSIIGRLMDTDKTNEKSDNSTLKESLNLDFLAQIS